MYDLDDATRSYEVTIIFFLVLMRLPSTMMKIIDGFWLGDASYKVKSAM